MRPLLSFLLFLTLTALFSNAHAVPQGQTLEWDSRGGGKVVFDGALHSAKGKVCNDCHPGLFRMKKDTTDMTMKKMFEGEACGACHNGKDAFDVKSLNDCKRCHDMH